MKILKMSALLLVIYPGILTANEKDFYEAVINLQSIERFFYGQPIYLSKDEALKSTLKKKLSRIITNLETYNETNPKTPDDYRVLFFLGKSYSFAHDLNVTGAWQKSVEYLKRAIDINANDYESHMILGKNYMDAQRFEDAYELYRTAYKLDAKSEAQKFMAFSLMYQKRTTEAITTMRSYVASHPSDLNAARTLKALEEGNFSTEVTSAPSKSKT